MNSNMVKPEKFDHLHLVYNFTIPLSMLLTLFFYFGFLLSKPIFGTSFSLELSLELPLVSGRT